MGRKKKVQEPEEEFIGPPEYEFRYCISLQDIKDKRCFKDVDESDSLADMKKQAEELIKKYERDVLITDYKNFDKFEIIKAKEDEDDDDDGTS